MGFNEDKRIITNQDLAYFMVDALGVNVIEIIFKGSVNQSRWLVVNTFTRADSSNPNCYLSGFDITEFFNPNRLNKPASVLRMELSESIRNKESRVLEFSNHFEWFLYK